MEHLPQVVTMGNIEQDPRGENTIQMKMEDTPKGAHKKKILDTENQNFEATKEAMDLDIGADDTNIGVIDMA